MICRRCFAGGLESGFLWIGGLRRDPKIFFAIDITLEMDERRKRKTTSVESIFSKGSVQHHTTPGKVQPTELQNSRDSPRLTFPKPQTKWPSLVEITTTTRRKAQKVAVPQQGTSPPDRTALPRRTHTHRGPRQPITRRLHKPCRRHATRPPRENSHRPLNC